MKKIPVAATIQAAYRFTFTHLGAIIGLIWLPVMVLTIIGFFTQRQLYAAMAAMLTAGSVNGAGQAILGGVGFLVLWLVLNAAMLVSLTQLSLGSRREGALVHFAFGAAEWRLLRAMAGLAALLAGFAFFAAVLANLLQPLIVRMGIGQPAAMSIVFDVLDLALFAIAVIGFRFLLLLPALAVNDDGPLLTQSWKLSAGSTWRIPLVILGIWGPPFLLKNVLIAVALSRGFQPPTGNAGALMAAQMRMMSENMPIIQAIGFLFAPLFLGLIAGASIVALGALRDDTGA